MDVNYELTRSLIIICHLRLILPLMPSFTQAGEFTTWGKLRSALRDNIVYYSSYFVIAVILVIYISLKPGDGSSSPSISLGGRGD